MERILKTIQEVLYYGFPKDTDNHPAIFNGTKRIMAWYHGDPGPIAQNKLPAISFDSSQRQTDYRTFHAREHSWDFSVRCYVRADDFSLSLTYLHEMVRLVDAIMEQHIRLWVFEPCIFDNQEFFSPTHLQTYSAVLAPYVAEARADWLARWNATHQVQGTDPPPVAPTLPDAEAYVAGYWRYLTEATPSTTEFTYKDQKGNSHTSTPAKMLAALEQDMRKPIRLLNFTKVESISYEAVPKQESELMRAAEMKFTAKEIDPIHVFGPSNVG